MKFAIAKEHKDFFQKRGWIEFEEFFPFDQILRLNQEIDTVLAARLKIAPELLSKKSSDALFLQGRDVWRSNEVIRKFALQPRLGEIASELIEKKPLRLGYDQFLPNFQQMKFPEGNEQIYAKFIAQTAPLDALSSLQGLVCGLVVPLSQVQEKDSSKTAAVEGIDIFAGERGHALFFQAGAEINWNHLHAHLGQRYYLLVYTSQSSYYQAQPKDPLTHFLKPLGYVYNDKLTDKLNPITYR